MVEQQICKPVQILQYLEIEIEIEIESGCEGEPLEDRLIVD